MMNATQADLDFCGKALLQALVWMGIKPTHNKRLIAQMPKVYESPGRKAPPGMTCYQVFTGPDAPFQGTRKVRIGNITGTGLAARGGHLPPIAHVSS